MVAGRQENRHPSGDVKQEAACMTWSSGEIWVRLISVRVISKPMAEEALGLNCHIGELQREERRATVEL